MVAGNRLREQILEEQAELKRNYGELFDRAVELLLRHDPIGINFGQGADEYEPEVGTILPRLAQCSSAGDVRRVVHEEFVRWFDPSTAGDESRYEVIAQELWELWRASGCGSLGSTDE
jgi:hypothetical protein